MHDERQERWLGVGCGVFDQSLCSQKYSLKAPVVRDLFLVGRTIWLLDQRSQVQEQGAEFFDGVEPFAMEESEFARKMVKSCSGTHRVYPFTFLMQIKGWRLPWHGCCDPFPFLPGLCIK